MSEVIWIEDEEALRAAINSEGRTVVEFTAPSWCAPCQRFAPHYKRAAAELPEVTFIAVDVDYAPWAMVDYGVQSVPTVKLYENGTLLRDIKAPLPALQFIPLVKE